MRGATYIKDTGFAISQLMAALRGEEGLLNRSKSEETTHLEDAYTAERERNRSEHEALRAESGDVFWLAEAYFHAERLAAEIKVSEAKHSQNQAEARQRLIDRYLSHATIAGAILQIAKQGISTVHGGLPSPTRGRQIGSQPIENVIWQGRNQAMHYEEGIFSPQTTRCFATLATEFGPRLTLSQQNLALEVIGVLGWRSQKDYESDMNQLLQ